MWIPQENEDKGRQKDHQSPPQLRQKETGRVAKSPQRKGSTSSSPSTQGFPKSARILTSGHFRSVLKSGNRLASQTVLLSYRLGKSTRPRLGITVSKKYGKSHERNRFKRIVREAFRELYHSLPTSLEANISPRSLASSSSHLKKTENTSPEICKTIILKELTELLRKLQA